jgi:hypothetical protein
VNRIDVGGTTAAFTAVVTFASAGPGTRADVAFRLDRGLRLLGATPAPGYVSACKALSPADRPASAASREDDPARDAFSVQAWERHPRAGRPR